MDRRVSRGPHQRSTLANAKPRARGRVHSALGHFESTRCIVTRSLPLVHYLGDSKQPSHRDTYIVTLTDGRKCCISLYIDKVHE